VPEDPSEDDTVVTIDAAIEKYLKEVKATKGNATLSSYARGLRWFRKHCRKHNVSRSNRVDMIALFGAGRDEGLNQKTINKRVMSRFKRCAEGRANHPARQETPARWAPWAGRRAPSIYIDRNPELRTGCRTPLRESVLPLPGLQAERSQEVISHPGRVCFRGRKINRRKIRCTQ